MPIRIAWSHTIPFLGLNKLDAHSWVVWIRLKPRVNVYSHVWEESCSFGQEFGQAWFLGQEHIDKMVYMHTCLHFKPHSYLMLFIWNWHYSISKTSTTSCGIRFISENSITKFVDWFILVATVAPGTPSRPVGRWRLDSSRSERLEIDQRLVRAYHHILGNDHSLTSYFWVPIR